MRGATDARETLGAQQLKTQYGSTRIRDKQQEMVRIARDLVGITSEIITEEFDKETMIAMSQTQIPTKEMQEAQAQQISSRCRTSRWRCRRCRKQMQPEQIQQRPSRRRRSVDARRDDQPGRTRSTRS